MSLSRPSARASLGAPEVVLRLAIVAAAAVGAALADAAPTGVAAADVAWRAAVAAAVTAAALTTGTVARVMPALAAAAVGAGTESWGVAMAACLVLAGTVLAPHRGRWRPSAGALLVGAAVQLLFRLPHLSPDRTTTVLGIASCVPVLVSGWRGLARRSCRIVGWTAGVGGAVVVAAAAPFLVAGALAWRDVGRGAGEADAWRVTTAEGEQEAAAAHLQAAADAFAQADRLLGGWWIAPARYVPLVGQHAEAAEVGLASGGRLVRSAQAILEVADPKDLKLTDGALDLDLVRDVRVPLDDSRAVLTLVEHDLAAVDTRWLLPFVRDDVREVTSQVSDARRDADFADRVLDVVPGLLGGDRPRRYFVVFSSPAETRELGGFLGNWGILTADGGRLDLEQTGRARDLNVLSKERDVQLRDPDSYPVRYVRSTPGDPWQNVTSSPDLPTVARAVADLYQQATDDPIDGVLVVDPVALGALLELTGPVDVPDLDDPLTADNAADFLLREQYARFPERGDRVDFLADAADATFERLTTGELPGPGAVADVLSPMVEGRHLLFWALDREPQPLLTELGLDGALPPVAGDVLAVARANGGPNKLDPYLTEELAYDVEVDTATGTVRSVLTVTYANEAPAGLPGFITDNRHGLPDGTSRVLVSVWTPYLSAGATLDGRALSMERQVELGRNRYLTLLAVPLGASVTLTLALEGQAPADGYRLTVVRQPLAEPSELQVTMHAPDGSPLRDVPKATVVGG